MINKSYTNIPEEQRRDGETSEGENRVRDLQNNEHDQRWTRLETFHGLVSAHFVYYIG